MFGFVSKAETITPTSAPFWASWFATMRNTFFTRGPSKLPGTMGGGGTGLVQGDGQQGNYGVQAGGSLFAMQISTVWACVCLIAELVASLPVVVYKRMPDGGREEQRGHPLWELLHEQPNSLQTKVEWLEQQMLNILLDGNCYDRIVKMGDRVVALQPMAAQQVDVELLATGRLEYSFFPEGSTSNPKKLSGDDVMQSRLFSNGLKGLSPLGYARLTIAQAQVLQENALNFAAKGNKASGVLMVDHIFKPGQRDAIRENFKELEQNNTRLFVLEAGFKYQQLTISPAEAQMMDQRKFNVQDICRIYRVPSYMVNDSEKATTWGSGLEQMNLAFLGYTLRPYLTRFEQTWNNRLLTPAERAAGLYIEFNLEALLRADSKGRAEFYGAAVQNGLMTRNEVRRKENFPASVQKNADALTVQTNLTPLEKLGDKPPAPTPGVKPPAKPEPEPTEEED